MDMRKTAREIGLFETALNVSDVSSSDAVRQKVGAAMPLPVGDISSRVAYAAQWLTRFGKKKYMFLTPELALIEALSKLDQEGTEAIIAVPTSLDADAKTRLRNNLPRGIHVSILEEPYFPDNFYPRNGMMVACGYSAAGKAMALPETYRMLAHYSDFKGKKVFVPYVELENAFRYGGWMEVNMQNLSASMEEAA